MPVMEAAGGAGFAVETLAVFVGHRAAQRNRKNPLDGHGAVHHQVAALVDHPHGTLTKFLQNFVTTDDGGGAHDWAMNRCSLTHAAKTERQFGEAAVGWGKTVKAGEKFGNGKGSFPQPSSFPS